MFVISLVIIMLFIMTDISDNCVDNSCVNGRCVEEIGGYYCDCDGGYTGEICNILIIITFTG